MSKSILFARHARRRMDLAVSRVYRSLAGEPERAAAFAELLRVARRRSGLLRAAEFRGARVLVVEALSNLSAFAEEFVRPVASWPGSSGSLLPAVASLAGHLLARYPVPRFLARVWWEEGRARGGRMRRWFVEHGRGRRFRDLDLPMAMTRRMESLFLGSPDHLTVAAALRRAELLALGAPPALVDAVLLTRLGRELDRGAFWRTVLAFFVRVSDDLDPNEVGPVVDYLQSVRHERVEVETEDGPRILEPPRPSYSMKGRTLASLRRQIARWHESLGVTPGPQIRWNPSRYRPMIVEEPAADAETPPVLWEFVELTSGSQLRREGAALRHCVAIYAGVCARNRARIWSLRRRSSRGAVRSRVTIEIDPETSRIVQARGLQNRRVTGRPLALLREWARRERLRISEGAGC